MLKYTAFTVALILLLALVSVVLAGGVPATIVSDGASNMLVASVLASGGQVSSSANYSVEATVGQASIGHGSSASYSLCSGFWCQIDAFFRTLLPLVLKNP